MTNTTFVTGKIKTKGDTKAIQEQLFEMGYFWNAPGAREANEVHETAPYLFLATNGLLTLMSDEVTDNSYFRHHRYNHVQVKVTTTINREIVPAESELITVKSGDYTLEELEAILADARLKA